MKHITKPFTITPQQLTDLKRLQFENEHNKVRIILCQIFNAPKELLSIFEEIYNRTEKCGLTYKDWELRSKTTSKLNKFIKSTYGNYAEDIAISVQ